MIFEFKTKPNKNGNTFYITFNNEKKTYSKGYYISAHNAIIIKKSDADRLEKMLLENGFRRA